MIAVANLFHLSHKSTLLVSNSLSLCIQHDHYFTVYKLYFPSDFLSFYCKEKKVLPVMLMLLLNCESCIWFAKVGQNCRIFPLITLILNKQAKPSDTQGTTNMIYCFKAQDRGLSAFL